MTTFIRNILTLIAAALATVGASAGTVTYYHNDIAGNPVAATNAQGQVIWRESYRPFGERTVNSAAALDNKIWFTSRRQDADTGLIYMGARYYDPVIGRFISIDPVGFDERNLHSFNRYAYANNNPYRYNDPDGREPGSLYQRGYVPPPAQIFPEPGLGRVIPEALLIPGIAGLAARAASSGEAPLPNSGPATAGQANKFNHVFGKAEHKLDPLVQASGSEARAYDAVQRAANQALKDGRLKPDSNGILPGGSAGEVLNVNGVNVQLVGGRVVEGEVRIGSFSRKLLND